jgi:hypothetical protein
VGLRNGARQRERSKAHHDGADLRPRFSETEIRNRAGAAAELPSLAVARAWRCRAEVPSSQPGLRAHRAVVPCIGHALTRAGRSITEKPGLQALVMATDASRETSLTDVVVTEL